MGVQENSLEIIKQYLADEFCMEQDEVIEMVELFLESINDSITNAENGVANSDAAQIAAIGHAVKGSSANINATTFSQLGLELESAGKDGDIAAASKIVDNLKEAITILKQQYES